MHVRLARVLPFLALDIPDGEATGAVLTRALRAAAAGDPAAWGLCESLPQSEGSGMCKVAASAAMPDRGAACDRIRRAYWRGECWFELSEDHAAAGRWDAAIEACRHAEAFGGDCARHVWWSSVAASGARDEALLLRLATTFHLEPAQIDLGSEVVRQVTEEAEEREAARLRAEADVEAAEASLRWRGFFREQHRLDTRVCPDAERDACLPAARDEFRARWERALEQNAAARSLLCEGHGRVGDRLRPGDDPELITVLDTLRQGACGPD